MTGSFLIGGAFRFPICEVADSVVKWRAGRLVAQDRGHGAVHKLDWINWNLMLIITDTSAYRRKRRRWCVCPCVVRQEPRAKKTIIDDIHGSIHVRPFKVGLLLLAPVNQQPAPTQSYSTSIVCLLATSCVLQVTTVPTILGRQDCCWSLRSS